MGARSAGNPHAACDVAGAGDVVRSKRLDQAGAPVLDPTAEKGGGEPFKNHVLETFQDMNIKELREVQRRYSNAFKHATDRKGQDRDDERILASFDGSVNDATLFIGWYDYGMSGLPRPVEAQVFEAWYLECLSWYIQLGVVMAWHGTS
jgi:hypothetical protein